MAQGTLASSLERLYHDYNREDSAADPVQLVRPYSRPEDREIAGFCAAALAFGRVASVLASISTLFRIMGDRPAQFVRAFDPSEEHPELRAMVHRWTRGVDIAALLWILRQMLERSGSVEAFFAEGLARLGCRRQRRARQLFDARPGDRRAPGLRARAEARRRLLFLSAAVSGQRLQAPQPVPALDGAQR